MNETNFTKNELLITLLCFFISTIGLLVIIGWHTHDYTLIQFESSLIPMSYNSAILTLLSGVGLWLLYKDKPIICFALGAFIFLAGLTVLSQHIFDVELGVDQMFMSAELTRHEVNPGRIGVLASLGFIAHSSTLASVLIIRRYRLILCLGALILGISVTSLVSILFDLMTEKEFGKQSMMSLYESVVFCLIGTCILLIEQLKNIQSTLVIHRRKLIKSSLVLLTLAIVGWQSFSHIEMKKKHANLTQTLSLFELNLTDTINSHIKAVQRMANRWEIQQGTSEDLWLADASNYIKDFNYFTSLKWIDQNYNIQWTTLESNDVTTNELDIVKSHLSNIVEARQSNRIYITKPETKTQGITSIYIYVPIIIVHRFDGFLLAEIDFSSLVNNAALLTNIGRPYHVTFSDSETEQEILNVSQGNFEFPLDQNKVVSTLVAFDGYALKVELAVTDREEGLFQKELSTFVLILSMMFISLIIWLLHLRWTALQSAFHLESEAETRRLIQIELAKNEERMRSVFNHIADAVILVSGSGLITRINRATERMFGVSALNAVNQDIKMIFPPPYNQVEGNVLTEYFFESQVEHLSTKKEMVGMRSNGSIFNMMIAVSRFQVDNTQYFCVVANDITHQKKASFEIEQYTKLLEQKNKELESFVYVASHDLKAPLRGIVQLADWIDEDLGDAKSAEISEYLDLMNSRINRLQGLLDNLLEYSKIGRDSGELTQVNLEQLLDNVFDLIDPPKGFKIEKELFEKEINTLSVPLELILRNLIQNSVKHHDKDCGLVTIKLEKHSRSYLQFTITDDGPGILPEHHKKIFTMFQTLRPRDEVEGSGMGLSFVQKLIDIYYCNIRVESDGVRGTSIIFTWPNESLLKSYVNEQL
jgi:PAS domain S-box-containing protein